MRTCFLPGPVCSRSQLTQQRRLVFAPADKVDIIWNSIASAFLPSYIANDTVLTMRLKLRSSKERLLPHLHSSRR